MKLIYIDPPYNTGSDSFNYNDKFNHSTWLTFMKNRLDEAKKFLRDDGVIFIQCDDNEQAYLKVLCDEIFGRENFDSCITHIVKPEGRMYGNIAKTHEYILVYARHINHLEFNEIEKNEHKFEYEDELGGYNLRELRNGAIGYFTAENRPNLRYPFYVDKDLNVFLDYADNRAEVWAKDNSVWTWGKEKCAANLNELVAQKGKDGQIRIYRKMRSNTTKFKSLINDKEAYSVKGTNENKSLFLGDNTKSFSNPKPEALLKRIIEIATNKGDLVMDFFAGSGTTLAVAHKMQRRWIGIEQMDYVESITKERLKKVVSGEQGGVSKALNWQGGGGFIYTELMPLNAVYREKILESSDEKELEKLYNDLESKAFTNYRVDIQEMLKDKNAQKDKEANIYKEFHNLSLEEKKGILYAILDPNMDYVPYSEIEDKSYEVSDELIELNRIFYGEGDFSQPFNEGGNTESSLQDEAKAIHISESKQIDCHALPSKARNDGASDRDNTETHNDKVSGRDNNNAEAKSRNNKKAKSSIKNLESKGGKDE